MEKCIKSVLIGGEDVEVIIVDDGSTKDDTAEIADRYAKMYPTIVSCSSGKWRTWTGCEYRTCTCHRKVF